MSIVLNLEPEMEADLLGEAERAGMPISDYIGWLLITAIPPTPALKTGAELVAYWEREGLIGSRPDLNDPAALARVTPDRPEGCGE